MLICTCSFKKKLPYFARIFQDSRFGSDLSILEIGFCRKGLNLNLSYFWVINKHKSYSNKPQMWNCFSFHQVLHALNTSGTQQSRKMSTCFILCRQSSCYDAFGTLNGSAEMVMTVVSLRFVPLHATATWIPFKIPLLWLIQQWSPIVFFYHLRCRAVQRGKSQTHYCVVLTVTSKSRSQFHVLRWDVFIPKRKQGKASNEEQL